jgi:hypothetical protein
MAKIKFNNKGLAQVYQDMAAKIDRVDKEVRAAHSGKPATEVEPAARAAFARVSIDLGSALKEYAEAVEKNEPFRFELQ